MLIWVLACGISVSVLANLVLLFSHYRERKHAEAIERDASATDSISALDFQTQPATLVNPRSPLIIAVDDLAARHLDDESYDELHKSLTGFAQRLLASAQLESTQANSQNPFAKISRRNVEDGLREMYKSMGVEEQRAKNRANRIRELMVAIFAAAVGMAIEAFLDMRAVSRTGQIVVVFLMLAISGLSFYFMSNE